MERIRIGATGGVQLSAMVWPAAPPPGPAERPGSYLLVHGLASNARMWDGVAAELSRAGAVVVAVDLRGHGLSEKVDDGYDFATLASDLVAVLDWTGLESPVAVGQSWGGNVVIELAARYPARLRGVGCVDGGWIDLSCYETFDACRAALAPPSTAGLPADRFEDGLRARRPGWPEEGIQGLLACFDRRGDGTVAAWLTPDRHLAVLHELWRHRPAAVYPRVATPVLLMPCDDGSPRVDRTREAVARAEAGLAVSRTHWLTAHHDVHAQRPEAVAALLLGSVHDGFFP